MKAENKALIRDILKVMMWLIGVLISIVFLLFIGMICHGLKDEPIELGGQYVIYYSPARLGVGYNGSSWQDYDDKMYVEDWKNSERFVLLQAWKVPNEIPDEQVDEIFLRRKINDKVKYFTFCYYIIDKEKDHIYGPLTIREYAEKRDSLGVPDDFRMTVKLKL